ncbi:DUF3574 domain-containing protein [Persicobacter diffluens]|uniref:DUF3574 domain-containing protein n=1 Tax=Persicobacter diffluens TaxID=981 RepID=A0AAN4VY45_9BACT|nr:hypothetical protein PEDI_17530 [Persicobacter diffluens]
MRRTKVSIALLIVAILSSAWFLKGDKKVKTELYFGLSVPNGGVISHADWEVFRASQIDAQLSGYSIVSADGYWTSANGSAAQEGSRILICIHEGDQNAALDTLRARYKRLFRQESVMRIDQKVRVSF